MEAELPPFLILLKNVLKQDKNILKEKIYKKPIVLINKEMNILGEWESASEAARELNKTSSAIARTCRERKNFYNEVTFRYKEDIQWNY